VFVKLCLLYLFRIIDVAKIGIFDDGSNELTMYSA
jgi:hypothetical protein